MGQWLLGVDVLTHAHGHHRRMAVRVVGSRDGHRVDPLAFLLEHHAKVAVELRRGKKLGGVVALSRASLVVHVAQRHDLAPGARRAGHLGEALSADADAGDVDPVVGAPGRVGNKREGKRCTGGAGDEPTPRDLVSLHRGPFRSWEVTVCAPVQAGGEGLGRRCAGHYSRPARGGSQVFQGNLNVRSSNGIIP